MEATKVWDEGDDKTMLTILESAPHTVSHVRSQTGSDDLVAARFCLPGTSRSIKPHTLEIINQRLVAANHPLCP